MATRREAIAGTAALGVAAAAPPLSAAPAVRIPDGLTAPRSEFVMELLVDVAEARDLGVSPLGKRRIVPITGGTFQGPGLRGRVLAGGADRQLIRADGVRNLDALYEIETDDGAIITVHNMVLIDDRPAQGRYAFSYIDVTAPAGPYDWLNAKKLVGTLQSLRPARAGVRVGVWALY